MTKYDVPMDITANAQDGESVRIAVLGPLANGVRPVLAADGYASQKRSAHVTLSVSKPGEHLVVVGSYNLATATSYQLTGITNPNEYANKRVEINGTLNNTRVSASSRRNSNASSGNNAMPMLRVTSVRVLGESCQ